MNYIKSEIKNIENKICEIISENPIADVKRNPENSFYLCEK